MVKIDRYIGKTVALSMLVAMSILISLDFVFNLADELSEIEGNYGALDALLFVLKTSPSSIYEFLPYSALVGALLGLGILASQNELVVIQAAGVTTGRIVWAVMKPTLVVMVLGLFLGEFIAPGLEQEARSSRALAQSAGVGINSSHGVWHKSGNEFIHINVIEPGGRTLHGITRYRLDDNRKIVSNSFAATATYVDSDAGNFWLLRSMEETRIEDGRITNHHFDEYEWRAGVSPELLTDLLIDPEGQSISALYRFASYFESEEGDSKPYYLAFWKKIFQPVSTAALVVLAISFIFGPLRNATMGFRLFVAILVALGFTIVQKLAGPASLLYGLSPVLAVLIPALLCFVGGVFLMRRVR